MIAAFATCGAAGNAPSLDIANVIINETQAIINIVMFPLARAPKGGTPASTLMDAQPSYYTTSTGAFLRTGTKSIGSTGQFVTTPPAVGESIRWTYWYRERTTNTPQWEFYTPLYPRT